MRSLPHESAKPAVFLDRDGTLVEEVDYLVSPERLQLIPGAVAALRRLNEAGIPVVLVTNQSMVARGMASEGQLAAIHERLSSLLQDEGAHLDGIYSCPHHPDIGEPPYRGVCACRKPAPGLLLQAARDLNLDLATSVMIGDSLRDLEAGEAAGCRQLILVRTGHGRAEEAKTKALRLGKAAIALDDLAAAVDHLLRHELPFRSLAAKPSANFKPPHA